MATQKVFIVDDDQDFTTSLAGSLTKNKMLTVFHFKSGEACLREMHQEPSIIILDYALNANEKNTEDGMKVLEKIRKSNPHVHIIMLSSQTHYGVAMQTIAHGAEQYVIKDEQAIPEVTRIVEDMARNN